MLIVYRYSDASQQGAGEKYKLALATKQNCLLNFLRAFDVVEKHRMVLIADNVSDASMEWLKEHVPALPALPARGIIRTDYKSGAHSFLHAVCFAMQLDVPDDTIVYLVEDDYIHAPGAHAVLEEGMSVGDYVTLYDHKDKYQDPQSSYIYATKSCHWRTTPSTTMTFATRKGTLVSDFDIYLEYCKTGYPYDHEMFLALGKEKQRRLVSSIPGYSTHAETAWLSPCRDWECYLADAYLADAYRVETAETRDG